MIPVFFLSSCIFWWWKDDATGLISVEKEWFSIGVPNSWNESPGDELPNPRLWEIELSFKSSSKRQDYYNNILIISENNTQNKSSQSLVNQSIWDIKSSLTSFQLLDQSQIIFEDEGESDVVIYKWRYNSSTPLLTYIQSARVCSDANYYITVSVAENLDSYDRYKSLIATFKCE